MTFDASQAFRYAMDFGLANASIVGVAEYNVYLITVVNDVIGFGDSNTSLATTAQRIVIADGYRSYAGGDGYLNPIIQQNNGQNIVLSNGLITANTLTLGPIVLTYFANNFAGGIDPVNFQPATGTNNNTQIYIQIGGPGLSPTGNFFQIKEVIINGMSNLSYQLLLIATADKPDLSNATYSFIPEAV
jgi:hypothetical protein